MSENATSVEASLPPAAPPNERFYSNFFMVIGVAAGVGLWSLGTALRLAKSPPSWLRQFSIGPISREMSGQLYSISGISLVALSILMRQAAAQRPDSLPQLHPGSFALDGQARVFRPAAPNRTNFRQLMEEAGDINGYMHGVIGSAAYYLLRTGRISVEDLDRQNPEALRLLGREAAYITMAYSKLKEINCQAGVYEAVLVQGAREADVLVTVRSPARDDEHLWMQGEETLEIYLEDDCFNAWNQSVDIPAAKKAYELLGYSHIRDIHNAILDGDRQRLEEFERLSLEMLSDKRAHPDQADERAGYSPLRDDPVKQPPKLTTLLSLAEQIESRYLSRFDVSIGPSGELRVRPKALVDAHVGQHRGPYDLGDMELIARQAMRDAAAFAQSQSGVDEGSERYYQALCDLATLNMIEQLEITEGQNGAFYVRCGHYDLAECVPLERVSDALEEGSLPRRFYPPSSVLSRTGTSEGHLLVQVKRQLEQLNNEQLNALRQAFIRDVVPGQGRPELCAQIQSVRRWWHHNHPHLGPRHLDRALAVLAEATPEMPPITHATSLSLCLPTPRSVARPRLDILARYGISADRIAPAPYVYDPIVFDARGARTINAATPLNYLQTRATPLDLSHQAGLFSADCIFYALAAAVLKDPTAQVDRDTGALFRRMVADYTLDHLEDDALLCAMEVTPMEARQMGEKPARQRRLHQLAEKIRNGSEWGGELALRAIADLFDRPVWIYKTGMFSSSVSLKRLRNGYELMLPSTRLNDGPDGGGGNPIELVYSSNVHYTTLLPY